MLLRYLKIDVRRAFGNWRFPICVIIISVLLLYNKDEPADVVSWMNHVNIFPMITAQFHLNPKFMTVVIYITTNIWYRCYPHCDKQQLHRIYMIHPRNNITCMIIHQ